MLWLINTGSSILEIFDWIKSYMPVIINCDIWIRSCSLENKWPGLSFVDKNYEYSYQFWWLNKWKRLKKWYNNKFDEQIAFLINTKLLNINEIILEMIHPDTNHYCRCVDPKFSQSWGVYNSSDNK